MICDPDAPDWKATRQVKYKGRVDWAKAAAAGTRRECARSRPALIRPTQYRLLVERRRELERLALRLVVVDPNLAVLWPGCRPCAPSTSRTSPESKLKPGTMRPSQFDRKCTHRRSATACRPSAA